MGISSDFRIIDTSQEGNKRSATKGHIMKLECNVIMSLSVECSEVGT